QTDDDQQEREQRAALAPDDGQEEDRAERQRREHLVAHEAPRRQCVETGAAEDASKVVRARALEATEDDASDAGRECVESGTDVQSRQSPAGPGLRGDVAGVEAVAADLLERFCSPDSRQEQRSRKENEGDGDEDETDEEDE